MLGLTTARLVQKSTNELLGSEEEALNDKPERETEAPPAWSGEASRHESVQWLWLLISKAVTHQPFSG
ncbi:hypothetical protein NA647_00325 [Pseudomonas stutzeri]|uniref:hypothetical protein n=1 Tax=Stutzerimonas stutzeri TaxID=316 RepID=UPI00210D5834|nr:hypothetical protein [Stutzerimonas stutzeri]MCQ4285883.1 hypothetical protein [Stutzerimonas stutzeri]